VRRVAGVDEGNVPLAGDTIRYRYPVLSVSANTDFRAGEKTYHLILLLACAGVLAASFILRPSGEGISLLGYRWPFYCWLHETLGVRCALCGMSRAFCSLAHGDIGASFGFHRLGPLVFAMFCLQLPYRAYALAIHPQRIDPRLTKIHRGLVILLCAAIMVHWLSYLEGLIV